MSRAWLLPLLLLIVMLAVMKFVRHAPPVASSDARAPAASLIPRGVWVSVFSKHEVLYAPEAVRELVAYCRENRISEIYLQVYRAGQAFYDSTLGGREKYEQMLKKAGRDTLALLLNEAHQQGIKVYAWINVLSLAQNKRAPIVEQYGSEVFTRDQNLRASIRTDAIDRSDEFYLRDDQIFLEPGDPRVVEWSLGIVSELLTRYPAFDGLHLDYVRYPYPVPSIPDGRFVKFGITYGYGERNVARFTQEFKLDPLKDDPYDNSLHLKWDNWKRSQVTGLVARIAALVRAQRPSWVISAAVVPSQERAYAQAFQDWPLWLDAGYLDHVVLMNYTRDERFAAELLRGGLAYQGKGRIYVGLGAFLMKDGMELKRSYDKMITGRAHGVVFFSYDELRKLGCPP